MRHKVVLAIFAALAVCAAQAQAQAQAPQVPPAAPPAFKTYFLIDDSNSMANKVADGTTRRAVGDAILSRELKKFIDSNPGGLASINFYRATPQICDAGSDKVKPQLPVPAQSPKSPKLGGATNLGAVLDAALIDAAGSPAKIVIISDGGQSERCGFHVCTVAGERLQGSSGIVVEQFWTPLRDDSSVPFPCIRDALESPTHAADDGSDNAADVAEEKIRVKPGSEEWEAAGGPERWFWLWVLILLVASALLFGARWMAKALQYERWTGDIHERQRAILTGDGDAVEYRNGILEISRKKPPNSRLIVGAWWAGFITLGLSAILCLILLGAPWFFGVQMDTARRLAWFVLSSNFSNTFAILGLAPMLTAGALCMRYLQARQNFDLAKIAAAEDEAKRRDAEVDSLFGYLQAVRTSILKATIDTPWADAKSIGGMRRRAAKYDDQDRQRLETVKKRLLEIAQGPVPQRVGASKTSVAEQTTKLERYAPKQRWWERNWDLPSLIEDLDNPTASPFKNEAAEWRSLAEGVRKADAKRVKASLKNLAEPKADPTAAGS